MTLLLRAPPTRVLVIALVFSGFLLLLVYRALASQDNLHTLPSVDSLVDSFIGPNAPQHPPGEAPPPPPPPHPPAKDAPIFDELTLSHVDPDATEQENAEDANENNIQQDQETGKLGQDQNQQQQDDDEESLSSSSSQDDQNVGQEEEKEEEISAPDGPPPIPTQNKSGKIKNLSKPKTPTPSASQLQHAAPWLAPQDDPIPPYLGLHNDLPALAAAVSRNVTLPGKKVDGLGPTYKTISVFPFNDKFSKLMQNSYYTFNRFADGQNSAIVFVYGGRKSLALCMALRLPCFDGQSYWFANSVDATLEADPTDWSNYWPVGWIKIPLIRDLIDLGYSVHYTDADVAFGSYPIVSSLLALARESHADMVAQFEGKQVNTGNILFLPTPGSFDILNAWQDRLHTEAFSQRELGELRDTVYTVCRSPSECKTLATQHGRDRNFPDPSVDVHRPSAIVRTFDSSFVRYTGGWCPPQEGVFIDPCDEQAPFIHMICVPGSIPKIIRLQDLGWWLIDDCRLRHMQVSHPPPIEKETDEDLSALTTLVCSPKILTSPSVEDPFWSCPPRLKQPFAWSPALTP